MNKAEVIGFIGKLEVRETTKGTPVATFSVATSNDYFDKETSEWVEQEPTWHNIVAWGKLAERLQPFVGQKRIKVMVTGKIDNGTYEKKDCTCTGYSSKIVAKSIVRLHVDPSKASDEPELTDEDVPLGDDGKPF